MNHYKLIGKDNQSELIIEIEKLLKDGWQLIGGIALGALSPKDAQGKDRLWYVQAMAR